MDIPVDKMTWGHCYGWDLWMKTPHLGLLAEYQYFDKITQMLRSC